MGVQPKTVVVVVTPGAVLTPWADKAGAVMLMFMPGQEEGNALADLLWGDVNPSGKLPCVVASRMRVIREVLAGFRFRTLKMKFALHR